MTKSNATRAGRAVRLALAAGAVAPFLATPTVLAQDSGSETTELTPMLITGSLIPTTDLVGLTPVDVFSQVEIQKIGAANVTDVVRKMPAAVGGGNFNESRGNGGDGSARVALRGIPGGTLVLINGRRVAPVAFADSDVDLNMIPIAAIERIEVLKDGASSAYGSDAIAGVVNVILRKEFEGVELNAYYGNTTERDASKQQYSFTSGTVSDRGSFVVGGSYYKANSLFSQDRERSRVNVNSRDQTYLDKVATSISNPGRFRVANNAQGNGVLYNPNLSPTAQLSVTLNRGAVPGADGRYSPADYHASNAQFFDVNQTTGDGSLETYPFDKYPFPLFTPAIRPAERWSIFGNANYKLFEETLDFFAETFYSHSFSQNQLAPTPMSNGSAGFAIPASNYYNPFGVPISTWGYRFVELGPRIDSIDKDALRFVSGLRGKISETSWGWEVAVTYSEEKGVNTEAGDVNRGLLEQYAGLNTPDAFNPFGMQQNSPALVNDVSRTLLTRGKTSLISVDGRVNGNLFELPAGAVQLAVGGEHREEEGESVPDDNKRSGDLIGFTGAAPLKGSRDIDAGYGEIFIPIFSKDNAITGLYALNVRAQARYENYSDFGDTTKPGVKLGYNPIDENFTIHASYSESFRAPTYSDLYTTVQEDFPEIRDPYTGAFAQIQTSNSGNPNLQPQEAENILIGAEWRVKQLPGLKVALDYFQIKRENIPGGSSQYVVDQNARTGGPANAVANPAFDPNQPISSTNLPLMPGTNPTPGQYANLIDYDAASNEYINVVVPTLNLSSDKLEGFDISMTYDLKLDERYGMIRFGIEAQYLITYEQEQIPGSPIVDRLGDFSADDFGYNSLPRLKGYGSMFWIWKDLEVGFFANYTDGYLDDKLSADRAVDSYLTFDIQASYNFPYQVKLTVGCLNVTDEMPPLVVAAFADSYDRDLHDIRQRFWYVQVSKKF
ncbi:MAG: TonB-dependent receptor [Verrucomicrobiales bacterium]|nr:TonB-dependent receptor [Verrucomicrobiales bacterium]